MGNISEHVDLAELATTVMEEKGFLPDFSQEVVQQVARLSGPASREPEMRDVSALFWISIDNEDSRDLDQLTFAEPLDQERDRVLVAIADVDALVPKGSPIDAHAGHNTTSVYTPGKIFTMIPQQLCYDWTSLLQDVERAVMVVEFEVNAGGECRLIDLYQGWARNCAKLIYERVSPYLEGTGPLPEPWKKEVKIAEQLTLQDRVAQRIQMQRDRKGALSFETMKTQPIVKKGEPVGVKQEEQSRAHHLIENLMIAANTLVTEALTARGLPVLRRIVKTPERWERIVYLAKQKGTKLPHHPDGKALQAFLIQEKQQNPDTFFDLSLAVIKLIGKGEYMAGLPEAPSPGHFDLALTEYAHTTAPNRRYPDVIMQRLLKASLKNHPVPYTIEELNSLGQQCTHMEDVATKVERQLVKSAAAMFLSTQMGARFRAIVTGAQSKGTFARLRDLPVEGKVVSGFEQLDVGDKIEVQLVGVNIEKGYIDFSYSAS